MTPAELDVAYREQLRDALARSRAAWHIVPWQTRAMLAWMETHEGGCLAPDQVARSWVWADLHLNHQAIIWSGQRPFRDATAMRTALLTAWNEMIGEDELIVCLGDVTVGPPSSAIDEALAALPGTKLLVVGNHEFVNNRELPKDYGFEALYPTLVCECDPPLLLTHEPLERVPAGCIHASLAVLVVHPCRLVARRPGLGVMHRHALFADHQRLQQRSPLPRRRPAAFERREGLGVASERGSPGCGSTPPR